MKPSEVWSAGILTIPADMVELAKKNKLPRAIVYNRVEEFGWSIEKAVTTPIQKKVRLNYTKADLEEAAINGIVRSTFIARVKRKWDLQRAKTQPPAKRGKHIG